MNSITELVDLELQGKTDIYMWRKTPNLATTNGIWFDLSMSSGMPVPQYYAATPLTATPMSYSSDKGIFHGYSTQKYLRQTACISANAFMPLPMILLDYLMYYPFIDEGTTDEQLMDNTQTLPRYTTGEGVQIMAVSQGARTGGQSFYVTYTNSEGVSGRTSATVIENTAAANGHIVTSSTATSGASGAFIPLQQGDKGVRSIESVTMLGTDVGLFALVLVKPLASTTIRENTAVVEKDYFMEAGVIPEIKQNAYLNWICLPISGSLSGAVIFGDLKTVWTA